METNQSEMQTMFDKLYEELDGVLPGEILSVAKEIQPIEVGVKLLWDLGGRIREKQPGINLTEPYAYPPEVKNLNDEINGYSFKIAAIPLEALARAASANIDADEEIIRSQDLEGYVPIIIEKGDDVRYIALIDYSNHKLELPLDCDLGFSMNIEVPEGSEGQSEAMEASMGELAERLEEFKEKASKGIKTFDNPEEKEAITAWCERHSYAFMFVVASSIDIFR